MHYLIVQLLWRFPRMRGRWRNERIHDAFSSPLPMLGFEDLLVRTVPLPRSPKGVCRSVSMLVVADSAVSRLPMVKARIVGVCDSSVKLTSNAGIDELFFHACLS